MRGKCTTNCSTLACQECCVVNKPGTLDMHMCCSLLCTSPACCRLSEEIGRGELAASCWPCFL
jgi:hypothetical protein